MAISSQIRHRIAQLAERDPELAAVLVDVVERVEAAEGDVAALEGDVADHEQRIAALEGGGGGEG